MFTKIIVVVDSNVNVHDYDRVWFHVGSNVHPGRDVIFNQGPTDIHPRPWPPAMLTTREIRDFVARRWAEYGIGPNPGETW